MPEKPPSQAPHPTERLRADLVRVGCAEFTAPTYKPGTIRHIVLLRFAAQISDAQKTDAMARFRALQTSATRDGRPYIRSIEAGWQQSGEHADLLFEQVFIVTFDSEGDRNFYVGEPIVNDRQYYDPVHHAFKAWIGPLLWAPPHGVLVVDFSGA